MKTCDSKSIERFFFKLHLYERWMRKSAKVVWFEYHHYYPLCEKWLAVTAVHAPSQYLVEGRLPSGFMRVGTNGNTTFKMCFQKCSKVTTSELHFLDAICRFLMFLWNFWTLPVLFILVIVVVVLSTWISNTNTMWVIWCFQLLIRMSPKLNMFQRCEKGRGTDSATVVQGGLS